MPTRAEIHRHKKRVLEVAPGFLSRVLDVPEDKPEACVTYSMLLAQALNKLGYKAVDVSVRCVVGNARHLVVLGMNNHHESDDEFFHSVVYLTDRREIIDLTITQASRPESGWVCVPYWEKENALPPYFVCLRPAQEGFEPPSRLYSSISNPEALVDALVLVIEGHDIEVIKKEVRSEA